MFCYMYNRLPVIVGYPKTAVSLKLRGGTTQNEGRVEVSIGYLTGRICDFEFDDRDAKVVCRMLGYRLA